MTYPAKQRYDKKNVVRVSVAFNRNTEPELIEKVEAQESKNAYIKGLIRSDIEKGKEKGPQR